MGEFGPIVATGLTVAGSVNISTIAETYWFEISKSGFITSSQPIEVTKLTTLINLTISPELTGDAARVILTWGNTPSDLDSHCSGPILAGGRFHIYYSDRDEPDEAILDLDDTTSFGPETVTIRRFNATGEFYYYTIHNYTDRNVVGSTTLSESQAIVNILMANGDQFTLPVPTGQAGNTWDVFRINGDTGVLSILNTMRDESDPSSVIS